MGTFIAKQPNGLYCRFSSTVDCITHHNMTEDDYIQWRVDCAREDAIDTILNHTKPFEWVEKYFVDNNMTDEEFEKILNEMKE